MIQVQTLRDALKNNSDEYLLSIFQSFKCQKDEDIEIFLSKFAINYERKNICRTYFFMDTDYPSEIIGYFSLGINVMHFDKKVQVEKAYDGINIYENGYRPIYKLFMIGKNDKFKNHVNIASKFEQDVLGYIYKAQDIVGGGDLMYIDCVSELKKYYEGLGFKYLDDIKGIDLIRMIRKI